MMNRCHAMLASASLFSACSSSVRQPPKERQALSLATGSKGGGFLLYGQALSSVLANTHLQISALETQGTAENINQLHDKKISAALLVMGPTWDAWNGQAQWAGKPVRSMRALFPMYETPFHVATRADSGLVNLDQLKGKKVAVGPVRGTAEGFFRGLMESTGLTAQLVNGSPSEHAQQLARGEVDAIWFGAGLPVPAFVDAAKLAAIRVFGLSGVERAAFVKRFPYFAPAQIPAGTYVGQTAAVDSVAVWNFAAMHQDAPVESAYWFTRLTLVNTRALVEKYPAASATTAANLAANTFLPLHDGAARYYKERGLKI